MEKATKPNFHFRPSSCRRTEAVPSGPPDMLWLYLVSVAAARKGHRKLQELLMGAQPHTCLSQQVERLSPDLEGRGHVTEAAPCHVPAL